jgi:nitroreductase
MMLAAHALGYGAMWKTGGAAYDDEVKRALSLEQADSIVGFIYVGTAIGSKPPKRQSRKDVEELVLNWRTRADQV